MRNRPVTENFPMGYNGLHDRPDLDEQQENAPNYYDNQLDYSHEDNCPVPVKEGKSGRLFDRGRGSEKGLIGGLELDDLILIGLMLLIFMDGGDEELLLVLAFLFFTGFDGFNLGGLF